MDNLYQTIDTSLIPKPTDNIPKMNQLSVSKKSIDNLESFELLVTMFNLHIICEESEYYILDGSEYDLKDFKDFWNFSD